MTAIALRPRLAYGIGAGLSGNKGTSGMGGNLGKPKSPGRKGNQGKGSIWDLNTVLLANMNTDFTDESYYGRAVTLSASNPIISSTQSKYGGFSGQFIAANSKFAKYVENNAAFEFTTDFTIEAWVWLHSRSLNQTVIYLGDGAASTWGLDLYYRAISDRYVLYNGFETNFLIGTTQPTLDTWQHLQATRIGTTFTMSLDGVSQGTATNNRQYGHNAASYYTSIGAFNPTVSPTEPWGASTGYLDGVRISKVARYTSYPFTPPTAAFTPYQ